MSYILPNSKKNLKQNTKVFSMHSLILTLVSFLVDKGRVYPRPCLFLIPPYIRASLVAQMVKSLPAAREARIWFLGWKDLLEKEMPIHSNILAWKIPWAEEPARLQSMRLQRVGDWACTHRNLYKEGDTQFFSLCFYSSCWKQWLLSTFLLPCHLATWPSHNFSLWNKRNEI